MVVAEDLEVGGSLVRLVVPSDLWSLYFVRRVFASLCFSMRPCAMLVAQDLEVGGSLVRLVVLSDLWSLYFARGTFASLCFSTFGL